MCLEVSMEMWLLVGRSLRELLFVWPKDMWNWSLRYMRYVIQVSIVTVVLKGMWLATHGKGPQLIFELVLWMTFIGIKGGVVNIIRCQLRIWGYIVIVMIHNLWIMCCPLYIANYILFILSLFRDFKPVSHCWFTCSIHTKRLYQVGISSLLLPKHFQVQL